MLCYGLSEILVCRGYAWIVSHTAQILLSESEWFMQFFNWFKILFSKWHHNEAPWQVARRGADESHCTLWIERSKLKKHVSPCRVPTASRFKMQRHFCNFFASSDGWVVERNVLNAGWRDKGWRLGLSHVFVSSSEVLYKQLFLAPKEQHKRLDIALGKVLIDIVLIFHTVQNGTYRNLGINKCILAVFGGPQRQHY